MFLIFKVFYNWAGAAGLWNEMHSLASDIRLPLVRCLRAATLLYG
jgi:hypothetical protein